MTTLQFIISTLMNDCGVKGDKRDISTALVENFSDGLYPISKIEYALKQLCKDGYIKKERQKGSKGNKNIYTINILGKN